jgi:O-antigen/teichoic acid export membrane protein
MPESSYIEDMASCGDTSLSQVTKAQRARATEAADDRKGSEGRNRQLTSGRLLARNTVWNLLGNVAPMIVAVFCIPILIRGLGRERFGVLTLAWALIGYAGLFDLGLGRALTQLVARKLGAGEEGEIPSLVWTSLLLMLVLGLIGTAAIFFISPWLAGRALNIPGSLEAETLKSFRLLGFSLPFVITTTGLRGLLEAHQRFGLINALRIPLGAFTFAGPLLALPFSKSLVPVVATLVVGRVVAWVVHLYLCKRILPELGRPIVWDPSEVGPLLRFGGWMTISNLVSALMTMIDRFLIGALVTMTAVTYYATPYEMVTKLWLVPGALAGVMFPAFSTSSVQDHNRTAVLFRRSVKFILLVLFPLVLVIIVLAKGGLRIWLGTEFATNGVHVVQWLAVGVFINSLALVPSALVQGVGRPDLTAKLQVLELPAYLTALIWLTKEYGIEGAAIAWTGRVAVDALILFIMARRLLPLEVSFRPQGPLLMALCMAVLALAVLPHRPIVKSVFLMVTILSFALLAWFRVLSPEERKLAQSFI